MKAFLFAIAIVSLLLNVIFIGLTPNVAPAFGLFVSAWSGLTSIALAIKAV